MPQFASAGGPIAADGAARKTLGERKTYSLRGTKKLSH
jgi:hypothetical protein